MLPNLRFHVMEEVDMDGSKFDFEPKKEPAKSKLFSDDTANSGYDCFAYIKENNGAVELGVGEQKMIKLGFSIEMLAYKFYGMYAKNQNAIQEVPVFLDSTVRARSGIRAKLEQHTHHGTIDASYDNQVRVILTNLSDKVQIFKHREKICQIVFELRPVLRTEKKTYSDDDKLLDKNSRANEKGEAGFGSTGI